MSQVSMQEQVVTMVKEGKYTRKEIKEAVGCTANVFATYLSAMRNAANFTGVAICPIEEEIEVDGVIKKIMTVTSFEEAERIKSDRSSNSRAAAAKTPAERLEAADKRVDKAATALDSARDRFEKDETNREFELRFKKAEIDLELAEIEQKRAKALVDEEESNAESTDDEVASEDELM